MQAARAGDRAARNALYERFEPRLRAYLARRVGKKLTRAVSVSDLCQDTFLQVLDALRVLPEDATLDDFQGLLFRHAQWIVGKQAEKHGGFRGESTPGAAVDPVAPPNDGRSKGEVTRLDELEWLRALVGTLPEDQAAVVRLRLDGRTFAEIARELGIRADGARQRYLRGSLALRRRVEEARVRGPRETE